MTPTDKDALAAQSETIPELRGNIWEAPTLAVDGLAGIAVSTHQVKLGLAEHYPTDEGLIAKVSANIVIAHDQFLKVADALTSVAATIRQMAEKTE